MLSKQCSLNLWKLGRRARAPDGALSPEEYRIGRAANTTHAREALSAIWAFINADATDTGSVRNRHPLTARIRRRADVLLDEIGCELSQDGVRVHGFPGFRGNAAGKLAHAELAITYFSANDGWQNSGGMEKFAVEIARRGILRHS